MKQAKSVGISPNDGFRTLRFCPEAREEEAEA